MHFGKVKTPIKYQGGKQRLSRHIVEVLPPHMVYVEPYAGSAAVLFRKGRPAHKNYHEVLNDKDDLLVNFYQVLNNDYMSNQLLGWLKATPYSRSIYEGYRKALREDAARSLPNIERALAFLVVHLQSFNSLRSSWGTAVVGGNQAALWERRKRWVADAANRLKGIYIECSEAIDVIKRWDSPQTCFYIDPPYVNRKSIYYYEDFGPEQFIELVETLDQCKGSFVITTYEDTRKWIPEDWHLLQSHDVVTTLSGIGKCRYGEDRSQHDVVLDIDREELIIGVDHSHDVESRLGKYLWCPAFEEEAVKLNGSSLTFVQYAQELGINTVELFDSLQDGQ
jgi:DNA adenine methylase